MTSQGEYLSYWGSLARHVNSKPIRRWDYYVKKLGPACQPWCLMNICLSLKTCQKSPFFRLGRIRKQFCFFQPMQCFYFSEVHFLKESHWVSKACPRKFLPLFSFFWYYVSLCESFLSKPCRDRITYMDSLCQKMKSPAGQSVDLIHNIFPTILDSTQQKKEKRKSKWKPWTNKKKNNFSSM